MEKAVSGYVRFASMDWKEKEFSKKAVEKSGRSKKGGVEGCRKLGLGR